MGLKSFPVLVDTRLFVTTQAVDRTESRRSRIHSARSRRRLASSELPANIRWRLTRLGLTQCVQNLLFAKSQLLHRSSSRQVEDVRSNYSPIPVCPAALLRDTPSARHTAATDRRSPSSTESATSTFYSSDLRRFLEDLVLQSFLSQQPLQLFDRPLCLSILRGGDHGFIGSDGLQCPCTGKLSPSKQ